MRRYWNLQTMINLYWLMGTAQIFFAENSFKVLICDSCNTKTQLNWYSEFIKHDPLLLCTQLSNKSMLFEFKGYRLFGKFFYFILKWGIAENHNLCSEKSVWKTFFKHWNNLKPIPYSVHSDDEYVKTYMNSQAN